MHIGLIGGIGVAATVVYYQRLTKTIERRGGRLDLIKTLNADAIVLAGTDLNLAFGGQTTDYPVIDALDVHVDVLARLAIGQISLQDVGAE
jgi:aspartate/glutamate racemase